LDPAAREISRIPSVDIELHRKRLAERFPELLVQVPVASQPAPIADLSQMQALLEQILSVNQTMASRAVSNESALPLSSSKLPPSVDDSSFSQSANLSLSSDQFMKSKSSKLPSCADDHSSSHSSNLSTSSDSFTKPKSSTLLRQSSDIKSKSSCDIKGQSKFLQALKYLEKNPITPESTDQREPVKSGSFFPPSIDLQHQINRKKADLEANNKSISNNLGKTKKRKSATKPAKRSVRARKEESDHTILSETRRHEETVSDDEVDPDTAMGDEFSSQSDDDDDDDFSDD
jgi:hypothetical protein